MSILTSKAEAAAIRAAALEQSEESSPHDMRSNKSNIFDAAQEAAYARKVSTIDEENSYLSQKNHIPLEIVGRDRGDTVQAVIDSGYTEQAVKAAGEKREARERERQKALGKPRGWRRFFFFLVPDVTRHQIIKKKTAAFVDKLVEK